jgi:glycosyltransferase involved in cell wall biosynthesis
MKILHVIHGMRVADGGPPRVAAGLGRSLARGGHEVLILASNGVEPDREQLGLVGIEGLRCEAVTPHKPLADHVFTADPRHDIVHIHGVWNPAATRLASRLRAADVPYIVMPHGMLDHWSMAQKRLKKRVYLALFERKMLEGAARLHALNQPEYDAIADLGIRTPHFILPNGVDAEEFENLPPAGTFRRRLAHPDGPLVSYLARIHYKKGADLLVPAFCRLAADFPQATLVVAGPDNGLQPELEEHVRSTGQQERVLFPGMLGGSERLALLRDTDIFALPSRQEGHPMSIVEAAYVGKACLATKECHVPELEDARAAEFVELTVESVEAGLRRLLDDPAHRQAIAERARAYARGHYTWDAIADALAQEYRAILPQ